MNANALKINDNKFRTWSPFTSRSIQRMRPRRNVWLRKSCLLLPYLLWFDDLWVNAVCWFVQLTTRSNLEPHLESGHVCVRTLKSKLFQTCAHLILYLVWCHGEVRLCLCVGNTMSRTWWRMYERFQGLIGLKGFCRLHSARCTTLPFCVVRLFFFSTFLLNRL